MSDTTRGILLVSLLIAASPRDLPAQDSSVTQRSPGDIFLDDVRIGIDDGLSFFTAPLRFTSSDWLTSAGVAGAIPILIAFDGKIQRAVQSNSPLDSWWEIPGKYGAVNYGNLFAISLYGTGLFIENDDIRITGRLLFETLTFAGASVIVARYVAGRNRPYDGTITGTSGASNGAGGHSRSRRDTRWWPSPSQPFWLSGWTTGGRGSLCTGLLP